jgi:hypothetical protein
MADPFTTVGPHGTVVSRLPAGGGRPRLVSEVDRHGALLTLAEWDGAGRLGWARVRTPDGGWIGIEPGAAESPLWGRSDRIWRLDPRPPYAPLRPITIFQSVDYGGLAFIPPLAEPARLPPGAGTAVLNFLASLLADQGAPRVRYRGPYPTEQLFTALLESFRYDPAVLSPLTEFVSATDSPLDWMPAPHERLFTPAGAYVQLREGVEKVVFEGRAYYRRNWQGVIRDEPRVVREDGGRVVCSLVALGEAVEDHLVLDRSGRVLAVLATAPSEGTQTPLSPRWRGAIGELIAHQSTPLLRPAILRVVERLELVWGPVTRDLASVRGARAVLSLRLPRLCREKLDLEDTPAGRIRVALRFAKEVAGLLGPAVRAEAQAFLAALPETEQRRALESAAATAGARAQALPSKLEALVGGLLSGADL